jgi:hypothetical protein
LMSGILFRLLSGPIGVLEEFVLSLVGAQRF